MESIKKNKKKKVFSKDKKSFTGRIILKVKALPNNIRVDVTDLQGNILVWKSAGTQGMKNSKKSTPFSAILVAKAIYQAIEKWTIQDCVIHVNGFGAGRETALRMLVESLGGKVSCIIDTLRLAHNGTRPRKLRSV